MTPLEALRKKIEEGVRQRLVDRLLTRAVDYHCRKGMRFNCGCDYCATKRFATAWIGNWVRSKEHPNLTFPILRSEKDFRPSFEVPRYYDENKHIREQIKELRKEKRKIIRAKLAEIRSQN